MVNVNSAFGWVYYHEDGYTSGDPDLTGKWMYFWSDRDTVAALCEKAVSSGVVQQCKHTDGSDGVACFYGHIDDLAFHKRIIEFFIDNDMIRRTKAGKLYNISFKLDNQTRAGEYGSDFSGAMKLSNLMDLSTGEWLV